MCTWADEVALHHYSITRITFVDPAAEQLGFRFYALGPNKSSMRCTGKILLDSMDMRSWTPMSFPSL